MAAFFSVNKRNQGSVPLADAARLSATFNPLLKTLFSVWHPFDTARTGNSAASTGTSVDLPEGWRVLPSSAGGTNAAEGPNGEAANLGFTLLVSDLNNPRARQTYELVKRGGLRNTSYANGLYYAFGPDLGKPFVDGDPDVPGQERPVSGDVSNRQRD